MMHRIIYHVYKVLKCEKYCYILVVDPYIVKASKHEWEG